MDLEDERGIACRDDGRSRGRPRLGERRRGGVVEQAEREAPVHEPSSVGGHAVVQRELDDGVAVRQLHGLTAERLIDLKMCTRLGHAAR